MKKLMMLTMVVVLTACQTLTDPDFAVRYRTEMTALASTMQSTALLVTAGTVPKDRGVLVLAQSDKVAAALQVAQLVQAPAGSPEMTDLAKAVAQARAALSAAVATAAQ
jgi:hypothetical protein